MCDCVQKSRIPLSPGKGFHYKFECKDASGKIKKIELDASNDSIAKQLAEEECSGRLATISDNEIPENGYLLTFTNFSLKTKLRQDAQGRLWGNWGTSMAAACIDLFDNRYIFKSSIISMKEIGKCSNGQIVVMVEHY